jgi:soluble lytic murein transglycosylase-like protein
MNPSPSGCLIHYRRTYVGYKVTLLSILTVLLLIPLVENSWTMVHKPHTLRQLVTAVAIRQGLDPRLVKAVISVESSWKPSALSSKGATGLMQVHHPTWKHKWTRQELRNPEINLIAGITILKKYMMESETLNQALYKYSGGAKDYVAKVKQQMGSRRGKDIGGGNEGSRSVKTIRQSSEATSRLSAERPDPPPF